MAETLTINGRLITIARTPVETIGYTDVDGDLDAAVACVRQAAQEYLPPGTLYEVRASLPEDFGRTWTVCFYQRDTLDARLVPYMPGSRPARDPDMSVLHCRERVPERGGAP